MKTIGIAGITIPGSLLCIDTIVQESYKHFGNDSLKHPYILYANTPLCETNPPIHAKEWNVVANNLLEEISRLQKAGADFVIIPSNAPHYAIKEIQEKSAIPVWSIVDVAVQECKARGFMKVGIMGVGVTMYDGLYINPLKEIGIEPINLPREKQEDLHNLIFSEIIANKPTLETSIRMKSFIQELKDTGCDSFIAGCTEIPLVVSEQDSPLPYIDTTRLLAIKACEFAIME